MRDILYLLLLMVTACSAPTQSDRGPNPSLQNTIEFCKLQAKHQSYYRERPMDVAVDADREREIIDRPMLYSANDFSDCMGESWPDSEAEALEQQK